MIFFFTQKKKFFPFFSLEWYETRTYFLQIIHERPLTLNSKLVGNSLGHKLVFALIRDVTFENCTLVNGQVCYKCDGGEQLLHGAGEQAWQHLSVQLVISWGSSRGQQRAFLRHQRHMRAVRSIGCQAKRAIFFLCERDRVRKREEMKSQKGWNIHIYYNTC